MKKIKWHKLGVVAFGIWGLNHIAQLATGPFKTYFASIMMFLIIVLLSE